MNVLIIMSALLIAPAQGAVSLRWAPVLDQALADVKGPGRDVARGFDGEVWRGLAVRLNEIQVLEQSGVEDLASLSRFRRLPNAAAAIPPEHLAALERSLQLLTPVVDRLEASGVLPDARARASAKLEEVLSRALAAESLESDRRARLLASRYTDRDLSLDQALADSKEADALLHDRYPYLSTGALDDLARVYDSGRTKRLAAQRAQSVAIVSADERGEMRDAVR